VRWPHWHLRNYEILAYLGAIIVGTDLYKEAFADPEVLERLDRGQVSTLGQTCVGGHIRVELHPLFNVFFTVINNTADPSGVLQPRATWDIS
jgi:hypothetical protein